MVYASCVFCDDVKIEDNGKSIYLGVYNTDAIVSNFPFIFPQLNFVIKVVTPLDMHVDIHNVKIYVPGNNDPMIFPQEKIIESKSKFTPPDYDETYRKYLSILLPINNLEVREKGRLKVVLDTSEGEIIAGVLRINKRESDAPSINFNAILTSILMYKKTLSINKKGAKILLPKIAEIFTNYIPPGIEDDFPIDEVFKFQLTENEFSVILLNKSLKDKKIKFKGLPTGTKSNITEQNEYGFKVKFSPKKNLVTEFDIEY